MTRRHRPNEIHHLIDRIMANVIAIGFDPEAGSIGNGNQSISLGNLLLDIQGQ